MEALPENLTPFSVHPQPALRIAALARRRARPLELDVAAHAIAIDNLTEKNGTSVAELRHEGAELMAGIAMASGSPLLGTRLPTIHSLRCGKLPRIDPEMPGEILVQLNETGRSDRGGQ
jgi:hypothetical protein